MSLCKPLGVIAPKVKVAMNCVRINRLHSQNSDVSREKCNKMRRDKRSSPAAAVRNGTSFIAIGASLPH